MWNLWLKKKVWQQTCFHQCLSLLFLDPRSGIRDKHPGSATLKIIIVPYFKKKNILTCAFRLQRKYQFFGTFLSFVMRIRIRVLMIKNWRKYYIWKNVFFYNQKVQFTRRSKLQEKLQPKKQHFRLETSFFSVFVGFCGFLDPKHRKIQKKCFFL